MVVGLKCAPLKEWVHALPLTKMETSSESVGELTLLNVERQTTRFSAVEQNQVTSGAIDFIDNIYRYTGLTKGDVRRAVDETTPWLEVKDAT